MTTIIDLLNTVFWGYVLIYGLLAVGLYFTLRLGFLQFVHFAELFRCVLGTSKDAKAGITPFQALMVSLASRVGTGNIAGVAVAIYLGGPGAVFWMWMVALVGMATAYAESTLAQLYKVPGDHGLYRGGPAHYIAKGLGLPWLGSVFAVCLILSFGLVFNAVQANSIAEAFQGAFGIPKPIVGATLGLMAAFVIFGGIPQIARVAQFLVPLMAGLYLLLALIVIVLNLPAVPGTLFQIVNGAFGFAEVEGGIAGGLTAAMLHGVKRGLFSNEAGMGSAPNIAAVAQPDPHHPSAQGFVQALGVFIDTIVVCTSTAIMILLSGVMEPGSGLTGTALTQAALVQHFGASGGIFVAVAIFFFAFTSIIGNYAYAEGAVAYLGHGSPAAITLLRALALSMVVWGSMQSVATVFDAADATMGLMATINLVAIVALSGTVAMLTRDYFDQRRAGRAPRFQIDEHPSIANGVDAKIWK